MYQLAGGDVLKLESITKRPVNEIFNWLSVNSEVEKEKERIEKYNGN